MIFFQTAIERKVSRLYVTSLIVLVVFNKKNIFLLNRSVDPYSQILRAVKLYTVKSTRNTVQNI